MADEHESQLPPFDDEEEWVPLITTVKRSTMERLELSAKRDARNIDRTVNAALDKYVKERGNIRVPKRRGRQ
jgi:hypothetical protein